MHSTLCFADLPMASQWKHSAVKRRELGHQQLSFLTACLKVGCWQSYSFVLYVKVKDILVQALRLCTGCTSHRWSRGIAVLFLDHGTRRGWGVSVTPWPLFTPGKDPVPIVEEAGWAQGPVWTGVENLAPTRIRSSDHPARSQSLYRLSYPAHICHI